MFWWVMYLYLYFRKCLNWLISISPSTRIIQLSKEQLFVAVQPTLARKCFRMQVIIIKPICGASEYFAINSFVDTIHFKQLITMILWIISDSRVQSLTLKTYPKRLNSLFQLCWLKILTIERVSRKLWPINIWVRMRKIWKDNLMYDRVTILFITV